MLIFIMSYCRVATAHNINERVYPNNIIQESQNINYIQFKVEVLDL